MTNGTSTVCIHQDLALVALVIQTRMRPRLTQNDGGPIKLSLWVLLNLPGVLPEHLISASAFHFSFTVASCPSL